jgi:hypothetical protein
MYKQQSVPSAAAGFSVIGDFPDRLVVLRDGREIAALDPSDPLLLERMSRGYVGDDVRQMVHAIRLAEAGDPSVRAQLADRWSHATFHMDDMLIGAAEITQSLPEIAEAFATHEIRRFRAEERLTPSMHETFFRAADGIYETLLGSHQVGPAHLAEEHRSNAFLYRVALAIMVYAMWWIRNGSQLPKRMDKARNDIIDLNFAVYGTYFAGLMTDDAKARWMFGQLTQAIRIVGGRTGSN